MAEPLWAAAGPSRSTAASFADMPAAAVVTTKKKKRGRFSDSNKVSNTDADGSSIPSIINPPSPELVPRHSSSASSWGIQDLSDSDGDYDWPTPSTSAAHHTSPDLDRDELTKFARPAKRLHLETPEDRHTYGKLAGLQIDPTSIASSSMPSTSSFGRPNGARTHSGLAGAFGLSSSLASALAANVDGNILAPRVPPSSPTKADAFSNPFQVSASTIYQQAIAPVPPTSPSLAKRGIVPPTYPQHMHSFDIPATPSKQANSAELQDAEMRTRRGNPTSFEVEPDRIVVTSLDDTSSSEGDASSPAEQGQKTPDADTFTESKESTSDFVINNELIEKLEAHSRAVLTGTSERDNAASNSRSGASAGQSRSRRSGRRSGGASGIPSLGSLLSSRRRSAQSSPASSGYASPINAEDARGALILWKDPEEVLKATSSAIASSSPLKQQSDLAFVPEATSTTANFMSQPPVSFQSGSGHTSSHSNYFGRPAPSMSEIPGMAALASPCHAAESPLYAQQSSLSSSYFPDPSPLETRFAQNAPQSVWHANGPMHSPSAAMNQHQYQHEPEQHYGHHYGGAHAPTMATSFQHISSSAHPTSAQIHAHNLGAQPIDLSGCFGPAEEMDLDS
ncbi:hypothetical protein NDA18_004063 [Ustilago nuda]|nr:hypothetical protein NDA18_004063 [Ustilago nuda]